MEVIHLWLAILICIFKHTCSFTVFCCLVMPIHRSCSHMQPMVPFPGHAAPWPLSLVMRPHGHFPWSCSPMATFPSHAAPWPLFPVMQPHGPSVPFMQPHGPSAPFMQPHGHFSQSCSPMVPQSLSCSPWPLYLVMQPHGPFPCGSPWSPSLVCMQPMVPFPSYAAPWPLSLVMLAMQFHSKPLFKQFTSVYIQ